MRVTQPKNILAGFYVGAADAEVPEIVHAGEFWSGGDHYIDLHRHEVWEFYLQLDGESQWDGPGQTYALQPGSFFAVAPGVYHRMHSRVTRKHHYLFVAFDLTAVLARHPALAPLWQGHEIVVVNDAEALHTPFRQLLREISVVMPQRAAGLRLALDYLVLCASRALLPAEARPFAATHPAVMRVKELLDEQPSHNWSSNELARFCGLSAGHLTALFTSQVGVSPRRYLLQRRVALARELLLGSDVPITQLALELGFSSSQHFAGTFARLAGQSPQAFRQHSRRLPPDSRPATH
jgi:AraC-like DNA-binding protein